MSSVQITKTILPSKLQKSSLENGNKTEDYCPSDDDLKPSLTVRMTDQNKLMLSQDSELLSCDWPEKWDKTLGLKDNSEILCPNCEEFSSQSICQNCGADIKTNHQRK